MSDDAVLDQLMVTNAKLLKLEIEVNDYHAMLRQILELCGATSTREVLGADAPLRAVQALVARRDELLKMVANLSQSTPLDSEREEALNQRGALLAEVGTLRSQLAARTQERDVALTGMEQYIEGERAHVERTTVEQIAAAVERMGPDIAVIDDVVMVCGRKNRPLHEYIRTLAWKKA